MEIDLETRLRQQLHRAGYSPIPVDGKIPAAKAWEQKIETNDGEIELWRQVYQFAHNTGILTRLTPTIDIDILFPEAAAAVEALARERFEERGYILVRIGEAPKRAIILRTNEPFNKIVGDVIAPDGSAQKIELLCNGQQVVVFGTHPKTQKPYQWHGGEPGKIAWEELPYVSSDEAQAFVADAVELLVAEYGYSRPASRPGTGRARPDGGDGRGPGDWLWLINNIRDGKDLHDSSTTLAAKLISAGMNDGAVVNLLRGFFEDASVHDQRWLERYGDIPRDVESARRKFGAEQQQQPPAARPELQPVPIIFPFPIKEETIPPRAWAIPGLLMRRHITVLVAPSGSGKSLLTVQLAIACAQGKNWSGWLPRKTFRIMVINSEDDIDEQRRRFAAAANIMQVDQFAIQRSIALVDNSDSGAVVAKFDFRTKTLLRTPLLEQIVKVIIAHQIDIVFVDPFAETFEGDENSNSELKWAGILWREVARRTNAAICLVHHTKKYATGMAGDVDAARGAGALIGIARIVSTLFPMTTKEAEAMGIADDQRGLYLRYDDAKANLNIKSPLARWFLKKTITLNNATSELPGDEVGVLTPWQPKGPNILETQILAFFRRVDQGVLDQDGQPTGEFYSFETRGRGNQERSIVIFAQEFFEIEARSVADKLIAGWKKAKRLEEIQYRSPRQRKTRPRVISELDPNAPKFRQARAAEAQPQSTLFDPRFPRNDD